MKARGARVGVYGYSVEGDAGRGSPVFTRIGVSTGVDSCDVLPIER